MSIFVAYIIGLFSQTILPNWVFGIDSFTGEIIFDMHFSNDLSTVNLIPFASLFHYLYITNDAVSNWDSVSKLNILANLLLFFPMGFLLPLIWKNLRSFKIVITLGFIFVTTIEVIQAFIGRSSDIDDVILNVSSIAIGYGVFICVNHFLKRGKIK
ncbi:VanZ family protein [Bacillus alkalicellulosilyticus]|uniref:VanZ family protein n=1 Tax=Alkalihalobacterium alkalicellulosilyticum TaxID=1912214 RepID=UPI001483BAF1|nr:VanZ family protein [Bacillus alkalicellulosilyticus]